MIEPIALLTRLNRYVPLSPADRQLLCGLFRKTQWLRAGRVLQSQEDAADHGFVVLDGWLSRERLLSGAESQVLGLMIPGDLSEPGLLAQEATDHSIVAQTDVLVAWFRHEDWLDLFERSTNLSVALWWSAMHEAALLRERTASFGGRSGLQRLSHLVWELTRRLDAVGQAPNDHLRLPVSRRVLASAVGLSPRHLARVLGEAERRRLFVLDDDRLVLLDRESVLDCADCRDVYLHLSPLRQEVRRRLQRRAQHSAAS